MKIVAIGEVLWDLVKGSEQIGGAPFNFAAHVRRLGHDVVLVSAVGDDERGRRVFQRMKDLGLTTSHVSTVADHPTGSVEVVIDDRQEPGYRIHRPAAYDFPHVDKKQLASLLSPAPEWIYYGTLQQISEAARHTSFEILHAAPEALRFYDVNLRKDCYTPALVMELMREADVVKLNYDEARETAGMLHAPAHPLQSYCQFLRTTFDLEAVCVTQGELGCSLLMGGQFVQVPGYPITVADTVGAGDAFSAALIHGLHQGWRARQAGEFANRLGALIASRAGAVPDWRPEEVRF